MVAEWGAEAWEARVGLLRALSQAVTGWAEYASDEVNGTAAAPDPAIASGASRLGQRLSNPEDLVALESVVTWALSGAMHTALVALDGGCDGCPTLDLTDPEGRSLGYALHEQWPEFDPQDPLGDDGDRRA
jgi:hypothetical protein